jgi:hypothetical protein
MGKNLPIVSILSIPTKARYLNSSSMNSSLCRFIHSYPFSSKWPQLRTMRWLIWWTVRHQIRIGVLTFIVTLRTMTLSKSTHSLKAILSSLNPSWECRLRECMSIIWALMKNASKVKVSSADPGKRWNQCFQIKSNSMTNLPSVAICSKEAELRLVLTDFVLLRRVS